MGQVKGPRVRMDLQAVRGRTGTDLIDRMGIRSEADRAEMLIKEARKARLAAQAKALAKCD